MSTDKTQAQSLFTPVKPEELPNFREAHRGRVSFPILKSFMESGHPIAKLNRAGMGRSAGGLKALLQWYARGHKLPIKFVTRQGELYLIRKDFDEEGKPIPDWKPEDDLPPEADDVPALTAEAIKKGG